jgi:hypothetical protein
MYEGSAAPGANGEIPPATPPVNYSKEQLDEAKNSAAAAARREAEAKLAEQTTRLNELEAKIKESEDAKLTELERIKKEADETKGKLTEYETQLKSYKEAEEKRKAALYDKVEKEMEGLDDAAKALVDQMPLDGKLDLINQLKNTKAGPGNWGKETPGEPGSLDEQERKELREAKTFQERQQIVVKYAALRKKK